MKEIKSDIFYDNAFHFRLTIIFQRMINTDIALLIYTKLHFSSLHRSAHHKMSRRTQ